MIGTSPIEFGFDIDAYLAKGGGLMNLELGLSATEKVFLSAFAAHATPEFRARVARFGEFLMLVGSSSAGNEKVGDRLTESELRNLWQRTAHVVEPA